MTRFTITLLLASFAGSALLVPTRAERLQRKQTLRRVSALGCTNLANKGTYFTVDVEVGTPFEGQDGQKFSLVADTGSNHIIVNSCNFQEDTGERCFVGSNRSASFRDVDGGQRFFSVTFSSGTIKSCVASDVVRVGQVSALANESLFLMQNHPLKLKGGFEGVFGLGIPQHTFFPTVQKSDESMSDEQKKLQKLLGKLRRIIDHISGGEKKSAFLEKSQQGLANESKSKSWQPKSFLELAGVTRFSMCFNKDSGGVLRFGTPALETPLRSVGKKHWSLDFRGIRIGGSAESVVCSTDNMPSTQNAPCGIIPDSGTTNILGPQKQVNSVLDAICDGWARCRSKFTVEKAAAATATRRNVLIELLAGCESWLTEGDGLRELPSVSFVLAGAGSDDAQIVELTAWAYVTQINISDSQRRQVKGIDWWKVPKLMCQPAFGALEYKTSQNGPVWVLGTPLFYSYSVEFETSPPSMSFTSLTDEPCGSCGNGVSLLSSARRTQSDFQAMPRMVWGEPRRLLLDVSQPL